MFPKATKGDRFTKLWSKEFYNYLLDQIRQDLNLTAKPKSFTYDPVKALKETTGSYVGFTPVALVTSSQIRGGFKSPVIKVGDLDSSLPFGVLQSHCTETQAADLVVSGVSWCNVSINDVAHKYARISGTVLFSQAYATDAVAKIIAPNTGGPSLIQFPLPGEVCEKIQPGSYQAIAGETILPKSYGTILISTCEGTVIEEALNLTGCTFYNGNYITASVDPCCRIHFTGCGPSELVSCCDKIGYVCFDGSTQAIQLDGGVVGWGYIQIPPDKSEWCCDVCPDNTEFGFVNIGWALRVWSTCSGETVTANWQYYCVYYQPDQTASPPVFSAFGPGGTIDWSGLCDDPPTSYTSTITVGACDMVLSAGITPGAAECDPCVGDPEPSCCTESRWVCVNNDSREMDLDGGDETWDVSECCTDCTVATLNVKLSCSNGLVSVQQTYTCDGVITRQTTTLPLSFCNSPTPVAINISTPQCFLTTSITIAEQPCNTCARCCDENRWFCIDNDSREMVLAGDTETWNVTDCIDCTAATLKLDVECIALTNSIKLDWELNCDSVITSGTEYILCDEADDTVVITLDHPDSFLQIQMSTTNIGCTACISGGTTTEAPPV